MNNRGIGAGVREWPARGAGSTRYDPQMKARTWHVDAGLAGLFAAACLWMFWSAREQAQAAVRQYGHNVDSGAIQYAVAVVFLLPVTALFGAAAIAGLRGWRVGRYVHWLAIAAAACPIAYEVIASAFM
jgi:hypothetical protein